jgi:Flp pilus assembly protein TadG
MIRSSRGSAVVEFILVSVPLLLLSMTVVAVGLSSFAMAVLRDSAIEGARYAALADQNSAAGCLRASLLAKQAIGRFANVSAACDSSEAGFEMVELRAQVTLFGLFTQDRELYAISQAPREN